MIDIWFALGWELPCCEIFVCWEMWRASD